MTKLKNLDDLFKHELLDLYSAEKQLIATFPKMVKEAETPELKEAFNHHFDETKAHKERLENIFDYLKISRANIKCMAMAGIVKEGHEMITGTATPQTKDAGLISIAQRVAHYEMAGYGTAQYYAEKLGHANAANLLSKTLNEEKQANTKYTTIAEKVVRPNAVMV